MVDHVRALLLPPSRNALRELFCVSWRISPYTLRRGGVYGFRGGFGEESELMVVPAANARDKAEA